MGWLQRPHKISFQSSYNLRLIKEKNRILITSVTANYYEHSDVILAGLFYHFMRPVTSLICINWTFDFFNFLRIEIAFFFLSRCSSKLTLYCFKTFSNEIISLYILTHIALLLRIIPYVFKSIHTNKPSHNPKHFKCVMISLFRHVSTFNILWLQDSFIYFPQKIITTNIHCH